MQFSEFGFDARLAEGIEAMGYQKATPIQEKVIPLILNGKDIIASAQTGTGKTAAFLLPIIHSIISSQRPSQLRALIIVPTRELAMQIDQQMEGFSYFTPISSTAIYGGTDGITFSREQQSLKGGAEVVICTPGRMIAHINQGNLDATGLQYLVLDEADRMLDMGFFDDIMKILSYLPAKRQNLLFSATMPEKIKILADKILTNPEMINIALSKPADKVLQLAYNAFDNQKIGLVKFLLAGKSLRSVLIFCSTKSNTKQLFRELKSAGISVGEIHSDLEQMQREKTLMDFKSRNLNILVATDILSRGIDIEDIDMVINYDVPNDGEDYIHRIGRTARAQAEGVAVTFISPKEQSKFLRIENLLGYEVYKALLPTYLGEAPSNLPPKRKSGKPRKKPGKK